MVYTPYILISTCCHMSHASLYSFKMLIDSIRFNSIRFNSIQFNSIQFNSIQSEALSNSTLIESLEPSAGVSHEKSRGYYFGYVWVTFIYIIVEIVLQITMNCTVDDLIKTHDDAKHDICWQPFFKVEPIVAKDTSR